MPLRRLRLSAAIGLAIGLAACAQMPFKGASQAGDESFAGTVTGYDSNAGKIEIRSSQGPLCFGDFTYVDSRHGRGSLSCTDGRSGPFQFESSGGRASGSGRLGERPFTFTMG
jgi:hypothetical protein